MALHHVLLTFGALLLAGLAIDAVGRWTRLPRITLLVLFGIAIGPHALDLMPIDVTAWYAAIAKVALAMVAFLLGGELSRTTLARNGRAILFVSLAVALATVAFVAGGLALLGAPFALALALAGIGLATAPAATHDVIAQTGAAGPFTATLVGVVAIDDAWGLILFGLILGIVAGLDGGGVGPALLDGIREVAGAIALGILVGVPSAYVTGRIAPGRPTLAEALGVVLLVTGLALWFEVSFLLAGMTTGAVVVNLAKHHENAFHEIEHVEWPFVIVFFVLAGASLDPATLGSIGLVGAAYVVLRLAGRVAGGYLGGRLAGMPPRQAGLVGVALTPQAGVALGMALVAMNALPAHGEAILAVTVGTTVVFEIAGPVLTAVALRTVGETGKAAAAPADG